MGHAPGSEYPYGTVILPDGKTPAWGAIIRYFSQGNWNPTLQGMTDACGNIQAVGEPYWRE